MTKKDKLLNKFINNPWSLHFSEIKNILESLWFQKIEAKWSHTKFKNKI